MRRSVTIIILLCVVIAGYFTEQGCSEQRRGEANIVPLTKHWEFAIPHQDIPDGLTSISADSCGRCHVEIFQEWKRSTHAVAFQDLQFQAEWKKDNVYACLNCHTPLQNQQEYIVSGLLNGNYKTPVQTLNENFDEALQMESITCATCHIRGGNVIGAMGTTKAPHKTIKDVDFLSEKLCLSCHNVVEELNETLVCTFETGMEWAANWASEAGMNCITCHMPTIERPLFVGMPERISHFHNFPASGIPKFNDMDVQALNGLEITADSLPGYLLAGDRLKYSLTLRNSFAGHSVPTGDPERFILITFRIVDTNDLSVHEEQYRIGEVWEWYPEAKKISDNNLKPLEERTYRFEYEVPEEKDLALLVEVTKHRITKENAEFNGILGRYPMSITVWENQYEIN